MKQSLSLTLAIGYLVVAGMAMAYPSLSGPTGTGVLPTTAVTQDGQLQLAGDFYASQQESDLTLPLRLEYGVGKNTEVGGGPPPAIPRPGTSMARSAIRRPAPMARTLPSEPVTPPSIRA